MLPRCNGFPLQPWTAGLSPFRVKLKNALLSPPTSSPLIYLENALIMRLSIPFHQILLVKLGMTLSCQIWLPLCPHLVQLLNTLTGPITSIELSVVPLQVTELPWNLSYFPGCSFFTLFHWTFFVLTSKWGSSLRKSTSLYISSSKAFISPGPGDTGLLLGRLGQVDLKFKASLEYFERSFLKIESQRDLGIWLSGKKLV